jgi:PAS domain S-box-containing protein
MDACPDEHRETFLRFEQAGWRTSDRAQQQRQGMGKSPLLPKGAWDIQTAFPGPEGASFPSRAGMPMNTFAQRLDLPSMDALRPSMRHDLLVVALVTVLTFLVSSLLELNELLLAATRPYEAYQLDELPVTFLAMAAALAWFSWRRSRQAVEQLDLRLRAQAALIRQEEQYRSLFMEDLSGNLLAGPDGGIRLANPSAARILGLPGSEQLIGKRFGDFYADPSQWLEHRKALLRGEIVDLPMLELRRCDGGIIQTVAKLCAVAGSDRSQELRFYVTDISELTRMQRELADALGENRLLSQRYMQIQEEERRYLARELHDELGQSLNAIKVDAVTIRDQAADRPEIRQGAQAIVEVSSQVYGVVRNLLQRLRPVALDELGLVSAVQYSIEQWQRRHPDVRCQFESSGEIDGLPEAVNITVYRLVQECMTNIAKHAQARAVGIRIARERRGVQQQVRVRVDDDGVGFDPSVRRGGLGIVGLRERVEVLGGRFELRSASGRGTRVEATIPVENGRWRTS